MSENKYLGIDLGTTNSAAAVFDGSELVSIVNARGDINTPSVIRTTEKGIVVGDKAKRHLDSDPGNTFKEFKRLMGTQSASKADRNGKQWQAHELSAEVLKALRSLAEAQTSCSFDKVVITVPALFELPQSKATAEAARLAGFEKVELLPEPVASALASGWSDEHAGSVWLVYDLGGGTFDVSLLESRDGLLRVVAHDGDNFLGGRDIDTALVEWLLSQLEEHHSLTLNNSHADFHSVKRHLETSAEQAKIHLSKTARTAIELEFEYDDEEYEIDIEISQAILTRLCEPLIARSISICERLLTSQGLPREQLKRVVLVGGPAHMPIIQNLVARDLAPLAQSAEDPMSLVSRGAALYAATIGLACEANNTSIEETSSAKQNPHVWLQYPSVCSELNPTIMGRIVDNSCKAKKVQVVKDDQSWQGEIIEIGDDSVFIAEVTVLAGKKNRFLLHGFDALGNPTDIFHSTINIIHGIAISDPPLSRSIGVSLADGSVKTFVERGTPLPAKRTFVQSTIDTLTPKSGQKLNIPIVQGERRKARFCRKVGGLIIDSDELSQTLPVGSRVEITIEVDRGGDLRAQAFLPDQNKLIHGIAHLVMANAEPNNLRANWQTLNSRLTTLQQNAFRDGDEQAVNTLTSLVEHLQQSFNELERLDDDTDACQRLSRNLTDIEAEIEQFESREQVEILAEECENTYYHTASMVEQYGGPTEKRVLQDCAKQLENILKLKRQGEMERLIERLEQLYHAAHKKSPEFWVDIFYSWASHVHEANNPKRANSLVENGHKAIEKKELSKLRGITEELYSLMPERVKGDGGTHDSGIY